MLRIPWTAKKTNSSILQVLRVDDMLSSICLRRIHQFFGHIARRDQDNLENWSILETLKEAVEKKDPQQDGVIKSFERL